MLDFFNKVLIGMIMIAQAVGSAVGINQPSSTPLPIPTAVESPTPSATPEPPQRQVKGITQTNQSPTPKHDGSRTGKIIHYKSLCDSSTNQVYENELIPFTTRGGVKVLSTQGDIDCYYKKLKESDQQNTQPIIINNTTNTTSSAPKSNVYQDCLDKNGEISQHCLKNCYNTVQEESGICTWAYSGPNAAIIFDDNQWRQCSDESTNKFMQCQSNCLDTQKTAGNSCPR